MKLLDLLEATSKKDLSIILFDKIMDNPPSYLAGEISKRYGANPKFIKLKLSDVTPSQTGEDLDNASSRHSAKKIKECADNNFSDIEDLRPEDVLPIVVDKDYKIKDGNHRYFAATLNKQDHILAFKQQ